MIDLNTVDGGSEKRVKKRDGIISSLYNYTRSGYVTIIQRLQEKVPEFDPSVAVKGRGQQDRKDFEVAKICNDRIENYLGKKSLI